MFIRAIHPILRCRNGLTLTKYVTSIQQYRHKSSREVTKTSSSEVNTDVKPLGEAVKENAKTVSYLAVILLGVGVTGTLFYAVFKELFSSRSPNNIYTAAVKKCLADYRIEDKLGLPIKAYGEETRRGRRQHPNYLGFLDRDGKKHLRMVFYLQGNYFKATVRLEMIENESGDYEYKYLVVDINDLAQTRIVLEDNEFPTNKTPTGLVL